MTSGQPEDPAESARWEAALVASEQRRAAASQRADQAGTGDRVDAYGFTWGPARVERLMAFRRRTGLARVLRVSTAFPGQDIEIYISPSGRSVRVFRGAQELTASTASTAR